MPCLQTIVLLLVAITGTAVVLTRDVTCQVIGMSMFGLLLSVLFVLFQAPDVAFSQIVIGAVGLPLMILLTLAKVRRDELHGGRERDAHTQKEMGQRHEDSQEDSG